MSAAEKAAPVLTKPCAQCPWRRSNQGKKHFGGFYTRANLSRLWNQVRKGGRQQSCHLTDPSHPDHVQAGAREDGKASECPGSIILIRRELAAMAGPDNVIAPESVDRYKRTRKRGIDPRSGITYWIVARIAFAGKPFLGGPPIPDLEDDEAIGLPDDLAPYTAAAP